jgi:hypothetical protein
VDGAADQNVERHEHDVAEKWHSFIICQNVRIQHIVIKQTPS